MWSAAESTQIVRFEVTQFDVIGSNPLTDAQTGSVLQPFIGEYVGVDGLPQARDALQAELSNEGHGFYRVILPPQT